MGERSRFRHPRYRLGELLGEGGAGRVYAARDLGDGGRDVALKLLAPTVDPKRVRREFATLRSLRHPGIARALHTGREELDGAPFFTLERVRGTALDEFADRLRTEQPEQLESSLTELAIQLARAVGYLHRRRILHLDLKPQNVLVSDGGDAPPEAVLIDFGIARFADAEELPVREGTAPFVAPEAFRGEPPTASYDVYALGVTLWRVLSGRLPWTASSIDDWSRLHREASLPRLEAVSEPLAGILGRALAKDPALRFHDADELADALVDIRSSSAATPPTGVGLHDTEFVGRERELELLDSWLETSHREALVVRGDVGIGKTRFLDEVETRLELRGEPVLRVAARETRRRGLAAALFERAKLWQQDIAEPESPRESLWLAALGVGRVDIDRPLDEPTRRTARHFAATRLAAWLRRSGQALLVDDIDGCDTTERTFLDALARDLHETTPDSSEQHAGGDGDRPAGRHGPALVVACSDGDALRDVPAQVIHLEGLSKSACLSIDLAGLDDALSRHSNSRRRHLRERAWQETGGHPLHFLRRLTSLDASPPGDAGGALAAADWSQRARDEVLALSPAHLRVLGRVSILDRPADIEELHALDETDPALETSVGRIRHLRQRGLVSFDGASVRLSDADIASATLERLGAESVRDLRRRAATHLLGTSRAALEAAEQLELAGDEADAVRTALSAVCDVAGISVVRRSRDAATLERLALAAAKQPARDTLLEAASQIWESTGRFADAARVRERLAATGDALARRRHASALHRAGDRERARVLLEQCIVELDQETHREELLRALAELALLSHFSQETELAKTLAQEGLDLWRASDESLHASVQQPAIDLCAIQGQIAIRESDYERAIRVLREGVDIYERSETPTAPAILLNNLGLALHLAARLEEALVIFERARGEARVAGDSSALVSILSNVAQLEAKRGRFPSAHAALESAAQEPAVAQSKRLQVGHRYTLVAVLGLEGRATCEDWSDVEQLATDAGDGFLRDFARLYRAELHLEAGAIDTARSTLEELVDNQMLGAACDARLGYVHALLGDFDAARAALDRAPTNPKALLHEWSELYRARAEACLGELEVARARLESLARSTRASGFTTLSLEVALERCRLAVVDGAQADAERHLATARSLPVKGASGPGVRALELRSALLESRLLLARLVADPTENSVSSRLDDLIARAGGDTDLVHRALETIELEMLRSARHLLHGRAREAREAGIRAELLQRRLSRSSGVSRQGGGRRLWRARGMTRFERPRGRLAWGAQTAGALAHVLHELAAARPEDSLPLAVRRELIESCGLLDVSLSHAGERRDAADAESPEERPPAEEKRRPTLLWPLREDDRTIAVLRCEWPSEDAVLTGSAAALLSSVADALSCRQRPSTRRAREVDRRGDPQDFAPTAALDDGETAELSRSLPADWHADWVAVDAVSVALLERIGRLARSSLPVLITGESGTGKNLIARLIHRAGPRAAYPLVTQHLSSIPIDLLEADLFGVKKGAFSGADETRTGFLFQAQRGTFHLEGIDDASLEVQGRVLGWIEAGAVRPLGASGRLDLDVRFVASSSRDLRSLVERGEFRQDLYYRLSGGSIEVPPLRKRPGDLRALIDWLQIHRREARVDLEPSARRALEEHAWPGNVRELLSVLRRLAVEYGDRPIRGQDVERTLDPVPAPSPVPGETATISPALFEDQDYDALKRQFDEAWLRHLHARHGGDIEAIARELSTSTRGVYRRFEKLGLKPGDLA